jgi:hypothetical protein
MGAGKFFAVIFLLILLGGILFLLFGNKFAPTASIYDKVFGEKAEEIVTAVSNVDKVAAKEIVAPPKENDWCKMQEIVVPSDREKYARDRIIGWDAIEECCVRQLDGWNCALKKDGFVQYCYTANIGGYVSWANVDGYFIDVTKYRSFILDLMKEEIPNKPCYIDKYPTLLQPIRQNVTTY